MRLITFGDSWTAGHGVETEIEYKENPTPPKFIEKLREQNSFPKWLGNLLNISILILEFVDLEMNTFINQLKKTLSL